jgi:hypothetical protein
LITLIHCTNTSIEKSTFANGLFLQSLLHDPNPNSPANNEAAQLYIENRREYEKKVAAIVQASWNDDNEEEEQ